MCVLASQQEVCIIIYLYPETLLLISVLELLYYEQIDPHVDRLRVNDVCLRIIEPGFRTQKSHCVCPC